MKNKQLASHGSKRFENTDKMFWKLRWNGYIFPSFLHIYLKVLFSLFEIVYTWSLFQPAFTCFKVSNRNTRTRCEICPKLTIKIPELRHWCRSGIFIANFGHISHLVLVFLLLTSNMWLPAGINLCNGCKVLAVQRLAFHFIIFLFIIILLISSRSFSIKVHTL